MSGLGGLSGGGNVRLFALTVDEIRCFKHSVMQSNTNYGDVD